MRATVSMVRIGYGFCDIEVEVPDESLEGLTERQREKAISAFALNIAGNYEYSDKNSDYEVEGVTPHV